MRLRMYGWTPGELGGFGRRQLDRNLPRHRFCQLALQAEHVLQLTIVAASPEHFVGPCGDELDAEPNPIGDQEGRAFEHGVDIELAGDLGEGEVATLVLHR